MQTWLIVLLLFISGCATPRQAYIGMSMKQFLIGRQDGFFNFFNPPAVLVEASDNVEVYRTCCYQFYYFVNGKLAQIDTGLQPQRRLQVELVDR